MGTVRSLLLTVCSQADYPRPYIILKQLLRYRKSKQRIGILITFSPWNLSVWTSYLFSHFLYPTDQHPKWRHPLDKCSIPTVCQILCLAQNDSSEHRRGRSQVLSFCRLNIPKPNYTNQLPRLGSSPLNPMWQQTKYNTLKVLDKITFGISLEKNSYRFHTKKASICIITTQLI